MEKLVAYIAHQFRRRLPPSIPYEDLYQEGMIGYLKAQKAYKQTGCKYATYVGYRVRGAIQDYLRVEDPLSRTERKREEWLPFIPEDSYEVDNDYAGMRERLQAAMSELPMRERQVIEDLYYADCTSAEVAKKLNVHPTRITQIHQQALKRLKDALGRI